MDTRTIRRFGMVFAATVGLGACGTGVEDPQAVALNFRAVVPSTSTHLVAGEALGIAGPPMTIEGTNGTLRIDEIRVIVAEVELSGEEDHCDDGSPETDDCADVEAPPRFLDLPLDGEPVQAFVGTIPPGQYDELEFEIEDLEDDESDTAFAAEIAALRDEIQGEFPDWPRNATALVAGSSSPRTGRWTSGSTWRRRWRSSETWCRR